MRIAPLRRSGHAGSMVKKRQWIDTLIAAHLWLRRRANQIKESAPRRALIDLPSQSVGD